MRATAVMITGKDAGRYAMAQISVHCFLQQSYAEKELLIINHGDKLLNCNDPQVRELHVLRTPDQTLGDLRNLAIDHACGEVIVGWDDDDWHHPLRLETQVRAYRPGAVVMLQHQIRYSLIRHSGFTLSMPSGIIGTVLFGRDDRRRYPKLNRGEDTALVAQFDQRIVVDNDSRLYVRFYHAMNIWDERHIMGHLAQVDNQWEFTPQEITLLKDVIPRYESLPLHP